MTVNVLYTVWCDGKREDGSNCGEWLTGETAWEARADARLLGWECGKQLRSRDLCSKHCTTL